MFKLTQAVRYRTAFFILIIYKYLTFNILLIGIIL